MRGVLNHAHIADWKTQVQRPKVTETLCAKTRTLILIFLTLRAKLLNIYCISDIIIPSLKRAIVS